MCHASLRGQATSILQLAVPSSVPTLTDDPFHCVENTGTNPVCSAYKATHFQASLQNVPSFPIFPVSSSLWPFRPSLKTLLCPLINYFIAVSCPMFPIPPSPFWGLSSLWGRAVSRGELCLAHSHFPRLVRSQNLAGIQWKSEEWMSEPLSFFLVPSQRWTKITFEFFRLGFFCAVLCLGHD